MEEHRTEPYVKRVMYPGERFFAARVEVLKSVQWPFKDKPGVYLGAAAHQHNLVYADACDLLESI